MTEPKIVQRKDGMFLECVIDAQMESSLRAVEPEVVVNPRQLIHIGSDLILVRHDDYSDELLRNEIYTRGLELAKKGGADYIYFGNTFKISEDHVLGVVNLYKLNVLAGIEFKEKDDS
jgi:hypothetical protein